MDEANDAMFAKLSTHPNIPVLSYLLPKLIIIFCFFSFMVFAKEGPFEEKDIPQAMNKIFEYHIENKELNPTIVRRVFKIYIEQFDQDKKYFLKNEIIPYLNADDKAVEEIVNRLKRKDFSDFHTLNAVVDKAIERARKWRVEIGNSLENIESSGSTQDKTGYADNEKELMKRQKDHFINFYQIQKKTTKINTLERKRKVFNLFQRKVARLENDYVFSDAKKNEHFFALHFLKAFSKSLDAHTYFFSNEEAYEMRVSLEKQFEGIGVVLTETIDGVVIADLIKGSPALESKKISVGDVIVEINEKNVEFLTFDELLKALKQKDGGKISLGLKREGVASAIKVSLQPRPISMDDDRLTVTEEPFGDGIIGKLNLKSFYENQDGFSSEKDIKEALKTLRSHGKLKGIVLDLRENAGGFLSQAIKVSAIFMSKGVVVVSKYYNGDLKYLRNVDGTSFYNGPLVILTSKMSASAAEIVAGALQDYGVALVVGDERTFGKGSIQYQTVTNENADYFFKVTIGKYYTVSGKSTQIDGVQADIIVPTHYAPYDVGEKYLEYSLPADRIKEAYNDTLEDLEPKVRRLFQKNYLPEVQKVVTQWIKMVPTLKENSKYRIAHNPNYKSFLSKLEEIKAKLMGYEIKLKDQNYGLGDLQLEEASNILKDMIIIDSQINHSLQERLVDSKK